MGGFRVYAALHETYTLPNCHTLKLIAVTQKIGGTVVIVGKSLKDEPWLPQISFRALASSLGSLHRVYPSRDRMSDKFHVAVSYAT